MGTITTGVGLISGLDYQSLVESLMSLEARPRDQIQTRISSISAQKAAYLDISARITAMLARVEILTRSSSFRSAVARSSAADVLSATAASGAPPGTYSFIVRSLASTQQVVSRGFYAAEAPLARGTVTIESAQARVNPTTRLDELNGHAGVRRGSIKITNRAGQSATVSLGDALAVSDVLDKINAAGLNVTASVRGDRLVLTDASGGSGTLRVQELDDGHTAADLGFGVGHSSSSGTELAGAVVVYLAGTTPVQALNDGLGLRTSLAGGDFTMEVNGQSISVDMSATLMNTTRLARLNHGQGVRLGEIRITSRNGDTATLDLTSAKTISDVRELIEGAFGGGRLTVAVTGSGLVVTDKTDVSELEADDISDLVIEDVSGFAANDLGIKGTSPAGTITGRTVLHLGTLSDVLAAINFAGNNEDASGNPLVVASLRDDGYGLKLETASGALTLTAPSGAGVRSRALFDLGFEPGTYDDSGGGAQVVGQRIVGGLDTVLLRSLNGGAGFAGTTMQMQANGRMTTLNLAGAQTLADVIDLINGATDETGAALGIEAVYDATGTRIVVRNTLDESALTLSGDFAEALGLAQSGSAVKSDNLQRRYISEATRLDDLNLGRGVARGAFTITNADGQTATIDLSAGTIETLQDVIDAINALDIGVTADINSTGDGLLLTDTSGGAGTLRVEESGGTTARDLNILGSATAGVIDGSFEFKLEVGGTDTLSTLSSRIRAETTLATSSVLNDGTGLTPYRLNITALVGGTKGDLLIDEGTTGLGITTLTRAQDARIVLGTDPNGGMLLTSSSNTFEGVVGGLTLTANAVSDTPVTVTVARDVTTLKDTLKGLIEAYNAAVDAVKSAGQYNETSETRGILQGEGTLRVVQSRLYDLFTAGVTVDGVFRRFAEYGIVAESGNHLRFDEEAFQAAYEADPEAVEQAFTATDNGLAVLLKERIKQLTDSGGLISQRTDALDERTDLLQERVDQLNERLDQKRARLLRQFQALEVALSQLQSQQTAVSNLSGLVSSFLTRSSSTGS